MLLLLLLLVGDLRHLRLEHLKHLVAATDFVPAVLQLRLVGGLDLDEFCPQLGASLLDCIDDLVLGGDGELQLAKALC